MPKLSLAQYSLTAWPKVAFIPLTWLVHRRVVETAAQLIRVALTPFAAVLMARLIQTLHIVQTVAVPEVYRSVHVVQSPTGLYTLATGHLRVVSQLLGTRRETHAPHIT